jgi:hypothetical protein
MQEPQEVFTELRDIRQAATDAYVEYHTVDDMACCADVFGTPETFDCFCDVVHNLWTMWVVTGYNGMKIDKGRCAEYVRSEAP